MMHTETFLPRETAAITRTLHDSINSWIAPPARGRQNCIETATWILLFAGLIDQLPKGRAPDD
jgi:hypothetical protein